MMACDLITYITYLQFVLKGACRLLLPSGMVKKIDMVTFQASIFGQFAYRRKFRIRALMFIFSTSFVAAEMDTPSLVKAVSRNHQLTSSRLPLLFSHLA